MNVKILMIDDHLVVITGYKGALMVGQEQYKIQATIVHSCEAAFDIITNPENASFFDVVFLDYSLPPFAEQNIENGEDLGILIRQLMPVTKIVVFTSHSDAIRLYDIVKKIRPEGLLIKSDIDPEDLPKVLEVILKGGCYFSPLASERINEPLFANGQLDFTDRQIIAFTALGNKIETIADKIGMSEHGIKKRKSKIRDILNISKGGDEELLKMCRNLNLLTN